MFTVFLNIGTGYWDKGGEQIYRGQDFCVAKLIMWYIDSNLIVPKMHPVSTVIMPNWSLGNFCTES